MTNNHYGQLAEAIAALQQPSAAECRRIRQAARIPLRAIAEACGVTKAAVGDWERERRIPRGEHAIAWGDVTRTIASIIGEASK